MHIDCEALRYKNGSSINISDSYEGFISNQYQWLLINQLETSLWDKLQCSDPFPAKELRDQEQESRMCLKHDIALNFSSLRDLCILIKLLFCF